MPKYILSKSMVMRHKITLPQLKKYDITQKVIEALADAESRAILFSIVRRGKTASDLSTSLKIPLSSVYKKLSDLEDLTLVQVEKTILSEKEGVSRFIEVESTRLRYLLKNQNQRFHYLLTDFYERLTSKANTALT